MDEHSSSYASSHSSDSEAEDVNPKPKWNNERTPLHSTPKVDTLSNHVTPYWPVEPPTASEGEDAGGVERLRVETKVNVELHEENKLKQNGEVPQDNHSPASQPRSNRPPEQRRGILKNKITYPPPLTDKNMKNRLREKLSDYNSSNTPSKTPSIDSTEGIRSISGDNGTLIKPPSRPPVPPRPPRLTMEVGTPTPAGTYPGTEMEPVNGGEESDSDGSNETSI